MKIYSQDVVISCDSLSTNFKCHLEIQIVRPIFHGRRELLKEAKKMGWKLGKDKDYCPYCKNKI